jgi:murein DD-endopeptidase MepM/ murein hydrolase activator NlpD
MKIINSDIYLPSLKSWLSIILVLTLLSCNTINEQKTESNVTPADTIAKESVKNTIYIYGIPADSYNISESKIRANRFLSDILAEYGVTLQEIDLLIRNSKKIFDVRDIRSGNKYTILSDKDSIGNVKYLIYDHDPTLSYIFSFNDSLNITPYLKEVRKKIQFASVTIETSLWNAMADAGLNPELSGSLSEIYAWTVDFFGLQKGDRFKVIYEEKYIGDTSIGTGNIFAAEFSSGDDKIFAIPMIQEGKMSFYDSDGKSLRKAFLKAPLRFSRISSGFSGARMHPILRIVRPHYGVDYAAPVGTPVYSIGDGRITSAGIENESGRIVRIKHNSVYSTAYLHLSRFAAGIYGGALVKQGDVIGYVGSSGLSTGAHLDFRFYKNGYPVDPLKIEAPSVEPVLPENMEKFEKLKTVFLNLLGTFN